MRPTDTKADRSRARQEARAAATLAARSERVLVGWLDEFVHSTDPETLSGYATPTDLLESFFNWCECHEVTRR